MKRLVFFVTVLILTVSVSYASDYDNVRIKKFPIAMQCWTFHKFTFFETLKRVEDLGIEYIQAYANQPLSKDMPDVVFGPDLTEEQIKYLNSWEEGT